MVGDRGIVASSSLRQIKRNNYVNELTAAYNHQTEHMKHAAGGGQAQVSSFFNINSQSIPTSKKGTQKKLVLQDTLPVEYQEMTQPKLSDLLHGKQSKNKVLNPQ